MGIMDAITKMIGNKVSSTVMSGAGSVLKAVGQSAKGSAGELLCQNIIGLTEEAAVARCQSLGFKCRIVERDGKFFMGTADYRTDRIKINIRKNIVVKAIVG